MRALALLCLLAGSAAAGEGGYVLNGKAFPADPDLDAVPQCGRITVDLKEVPVEQALEEISRQAGFKVKFWMGQEAPVSVSAERAPLLAVLAEICRSKGWGLEVSRGPEGFEEINVSGSTDCPVLAYAVRGPILLTWHGRVTSQTFDFDKNPPAVVEVTKYRAGILVDPLSHIRVVDSVNQRTARDIPFVFKPAEGGDQELRSDHRPNVFGSGPPWEFAPREGLDGAKGSLEIALPLEGPSRLESAVLPFQKGAKSEAGETETSLEAVSSEQGRVRDPRDMFKEIEALTFKATLKLVRPGAVVPSGMPGPEEMAGAMAGMRSLHAVSLVLEDGGEIPGRAKTADGISSPWHGYRYEAAFQTQALGSKAKEVKVAWARAFAASEARFRIEGVEFSPARK